jgi:hypothetical protein
MSLRAIALFLGVAAAVLPLSGCGSGKTTATAQTSTTTLGAPATTSTTATTTTTSISSSNGAATAVLPAQFTLNADGSLRPPLVAGPVDTTIALTVASHASHPVTLSVASRALTVSPGGHASARLQGLKAGRYKIQVDGTPRAALVVGAQPGP